MKIDILCEGRLNKNVENDLCNLYIKRISSLKKVEFLKLKLKKLLAIKTIRSKITIILKIFY